jgi:hypothetical protein
MSWVQLSTIIGNTAIPPEAAAIIRAAVTQIADENGIEPANRWRCIEYMAAEYLAS